MSTGENIRRLREQKGMYQKDLAEAAKVYQAKISRIENGKTRVIKPDVLQKIADALGAPVDSLIENPKGPVGVDYLVDTPEGPVGVEFKFQGGNAQSKTREDSIEVFLVDFLSLDPNTRGLVMDVVRAAKERAETGQVELPPKDAGNDSGSA